VIRSFKDSNAERLFNRHSIRKLHPELECVALRKLLVLDAATSLADLRVPPSNHLEKLAGDRKGQQRIRINEKWRICFRWLDSDAHDVESIDYH